MMWKDWNPLMPLVGMENSSAPLGNSLADLKQSYHTYLKFHPFKV